MKASPEYARLWHRAKASRDGDIHPELEEALMELRNVSGRERHGSKRVFGIEHHEREAAVWDRLDDHEVMIDLSY